MGRFIIRTQGGSVLYVCTKFEADISISSNVIRGPKISKLGHVTRATPILNLKRYICVEIHLLILIAKVYASILICS